MKKVSSSEYYNSVAKNYHEQYDREKLLELKRYPANYFRLQLLINSFLEKNIKRVIEVGVGEGTPLVNMARIGFDAWGFDVASEMVKQSKKNFKNNGFDPAHIFQGDIQDPTTYAHAMKDGFFDGLIAMGVMPHVENDEMVIKNMSACIKKGGSVFIEFRNKLFSLFTMNRNTIEFIMEDLLTGVSPKIREIVHKDLLKRMRADMPPIRKKSEENEAPGYDMILSKFHNPLEITQTFSKLGFGDIKFLWYHYHPAMPYLESENPSLFRQEAFRLEHETSGWRGMFLCSAFVVEAVKL